MNFKIKYYLSHSVYIVIEKITTHHFPLFHGNLTSINWLLQILHQPPWRCWHEVFAYHKGFFFFFLNLKVFCTGLENELKWGWI